MYPAIADAIDDDVGWCVEVDYEIDGYNVVELYCLDGGAREAVEDEGCGGSV